MHIDESPPPADTDVGVTDTEAPQRFWMIPATLGIFVLFISLLLPFRENFRWAFGLKNWVGAMNFLLTAVAVFIGLFLIVYAVTLRRMESRRVQTSFAAGMAIPLTLWLLGVAAIWWSFASSLSHYSPIIPAKPCIELYSEALSISKQDPAFRVPAQDPDEGRCRINKALLGP